jgi:hypothetical protein
MLTKFVIDMRHTVWSVDDRCMCEYSDAHLGLKQYSSTAGHESDSFPAAGENRKSIS